MKRSEIAAALPAMGASLLPNLSCPACWPAYASILSAVGLSFLAESKYLLWLNVAALLVTLVILFRRRRGISHAPFVMGTVASVIILLGKFSLNSSPMTWLGAAMLLGALMWSGIKSKPPATCTRCAGNTSLEAVSNDIKES